MTMTEDLDHVCERCGAPLLIHAEAGKTSHAAPVLCAQCTANGRNHINRRTNNLNRGATLLVAGVYVLLLSALADWLAFGSSEGFGWKQHLGIALAAVVVLSAALMRVPTLFAIGLMIGTLTILADWLGFGNSQGFGLQQMAGSALGIVLVILGLALARANRPQPTD